MPDDFAGILRPAAGPQEKVAADCGMAAGRNQREKTADQVDSRECTGRRAQGTWTVDFWCRPQAQGKYRRSVRVFAAAEFCHSRRLRAAVLSFLTNSGRDAAVAILAPP